MTELVPPRRPKCRPCPVCGAEPICIVRLRKGVEAYWSRLRVLTNACGRESIVDVGRTMRYWVQVNWPCGRQPERRKAWWK